MKEADFPESTGVTDQELESLIRLAQIADEGSLAKVVGHIKPMISRFFTKRFSLEAEDLTQDCLLKICQDLPSFDPEFGRGTYIGNFNSWCFSVARHRLSNRFRRIDLETVPLDDEVHVTLEFQEEHEQFPDLMTVIREKIPEILSQFESEVINLRFDGLSNAQISEVLGMSTGQIEHLASSSRVKIEKSLLKPAGFERLNRYPGVNNTHRHAALDGRLKAVNLLGFWYVGDEDFNFFEQTKRIVDQELLDQGFLLLFPHVSDSDYSEIKRNPLYVNMISVHRGVAYIKPENLAKIKDRKRRKDTRRFVSPGLEYEPLANFSNTASKANELRKAAQKGRLSAVKNGHWWFTTQEAVDEFLRSRQKSKKKGQNERY